MTKKVNVTRPPDTTWDKYTSKDLPAAIELIFADAQLHSKAVRDWYWASIGVKRATSVVIRAVSFGLLVVGALLPVLAGLLDEATHRLILTQIGVASLALAGLLQAADRIFGWSSGWLRYITTVTQMESRARRFAASWASYVMTTPILGDVDRRALFDLADKFETDLEQLQIDETDKWVAEFNSSLAALGDLIQTQRESTNKATESAQREVDQYKTASATRRKASLPGAIQLTLSYKADPFPVFILLDDGQPEQFVGRRWAALNVSAGRHMITVSSTGDPSDAGRNSVIVEVPADGVAQVAIELQ